MKEILRLLEKDARLTPKQIATMTDIPITQVRATIKEAEEKGMLIKYKAVVNWEMVGEEGGEIIL